MAKPLAPGEIKAEVSSRENTAQGCLLSRRRKVRERTLHSRHHFGGYAEIETAPAEERNQHVGCGCADDSVRAGIRWVGSSVANFGQPIRIGSGFRIAVNVAGADRGDTSPQVIRVLGVVKSDHTIGQRYIQQGK